VLPPEKQRAGLGSLARRASSAGHSFDPFSYCHQVTLPLGVGGVGGGEPGGDVEGGLVGGQVAFRAGEIPELVVADGRVALPPPGRYQPESDSLLLPRRSRLG
jgi:hypothetical protein